MIHLPALQVSFLELPTEIVAKVFEELNGKDRKSLANVDSRLREIEKKAGCRRFGLICYGPVSLLKYWSKYL